MKKITGFFTNHGFWWHKNFPLIINETEKAFKGNKGFNVVISENIRFDSLWAQEIYEKSAIEKDFVRLWVEGYSKRYLSKKEYLFFKQNYNPEYKKAILNSALNGGEKRLSLYSAWSKLRRKYKFRLLMESGTTNELDILFDDIDKINPFESFIQKGKKEFEIDFMRSVDLRLKIFFIRDKMIQKKIDVLLKRYKNVCMFILFGTLHSSMLDKYIGKKNLKILPITKINLFESIRHNVYNQIKNGKQLSKVQIDKWLVLECINYFCYLLHGYSKELELNPEKIIEILNEHFPKDWCEKFFSKKIFFTSSTIMDIMAEKVVLYLYEMKVLDILESEFPKEISHCKLLLKKIKIKSK